MSARLVVRLVVLAALPLLACTGQPTVVQPAALPTLRATAGSNEPGAGLQRAEAFTPVGPVATAPVRATLLLAAKGDGLIVSRAGGIVLLDAQLRELAVLSPERGRHLRVVGEQLYFFGLKQPVLRAMNLSSGETRTVSTLMRVKDPCFGGGPPADPIDFVQSESDLTIDANVLCLDIMDRNANMAAETRNFRVDLTTGSVEQRMVAYLGGDACGEIREREQPRLCTPAKPLGGVIEQISPSGHWSYYPDETRGEAGDYIYSLARVVDRQQRRSYAISGRKLRPLRGNANPVGACLVPDETTAAWLGVSDVLVLDGCNARLTVVRPPGRVEHLSVDSFAIVPNVPVVASVPVVPVVPVVASVPVVPVVAGAPVVAGKPSAPVEPSEPIAPSVPSIPIIPQ